MPSPAVKAPVAPAPLPYAGLRYAHRDALFSPDKFKVKAAKRQSVPRVFASNDPTDPLSLPAFNLAVLPLPKNLGAQLPGQPHFLGAVRYHFNQCAALAQGMKSRRRGSRLVFFDSHLQPLRNYSLVSLSAEGLHGSMGDVRLFEHAGVILVTFMTYPDGGKWNLCELTFNASTGAVDKNGREEVSFSLRPLDPFRDHKGRALAIGGRNFGLWYHRGTILVQLWAATAMTVPADWKASKKTSSKVPIKALHVSDSDITTAKGLAPATKLHNNGIVLDLGPEVGALLSLGHVHMTKREGGAMFGTHYFHYFLLLDREAPFKLQAQSPPFCLPAGHDATKCDLIQFIMSAVLIDNRKDVVLTYGINDCESAAVRVALAEVLRFTRKGGVLALA